MRTVAAAVACTTVLLLAGACSGSANPATVEVGLQEWSITPPTTTFKAGKITFVARNNGKEDHELELSNKIGPTIPDEASLAEAEDVESGKTKSFTYEFKPGTYELACRLVVKNTTPPTDHYANGMHITITVN